MSRSLKLKKLSHIQKNVIDHPKLKFKKLKKRKWSKIGSPAKLSDYGKLLVAKQSLKLFYGNIKEKQLCKLFRKAKRIRGDIILNLIRLLESRLDIILFRLRFSNSLKEVHQLISHKHILVNGKIVKSNGYLLNPGDHISVKLESFDLVRKKILESFKNYINLPTNSKKDYITNFSNQHTLALAPNYLEINYNILEGFLLYKPSFEEVIYPTHIDYNLISEYYKHKIKL